MPRRPSKFLPFALLATAALAGASADAQQVKPVNRRLCFIIAGTRAEIVFEKQGNEYVEVDAPAKSIAPSQIEIIGAKKKDEKDEESSMTSLTANLNEVVRFDGYKGDRILRFALKRSFPASDGDRPVEMTCDLGVSTAPLIVIHRKDQASGWDVPVVRVLDVGPASLPANALLCVNLTGGTLGTRFGTSAGSIGGSIGGGMSEVFALPDRSSGPFMFKVDLMVNQQPITIANSSYLSPPASRIVLLAIPVFRSAHGNPPVSLQFLQFPE